MISKKVQYIILIIVISMTLVGIVGLLVYPTNVIRTTHTATTSDGVVISYNLYQPTGLTGPTPVVVMGHGIIVNKEMMTNFALELATRGYIVASIDWRGHGQSTGTLNIGGLYLDLEAVITDIPLRAVHANMSALALAGYSMGGWATYQYALLHNDTVKAWVGIATTGDEIYSNQTNPNNVLLIVGDLDEAFSINMLKTDMVNLTGSASINDIQINTLYGNMTNGTARKLQVVPGVDHLMAPWTRDFVVAATNWITESFSGVTTSAFTLYAFDIRMIFLVVGFTGICGLVAISAFILANKFRIKKDDEEKIDGLKENMLQDHSTLSFVGKYYIFSFVLLPTIILFAPLFLIPLPLTAFLTILVGGLGTNLIIYCWRLSKKYDISMKSVFKENLIQQHPKVWLYSLILGVIFFLGYVFTVGLNYIGIFPSISKIAYMLLYAPLCFLGFFFFGIFIQKFSTPFWDSKLKEKHPIINYTVSAFVNFLLIYSWFLVIILVVCVAIGTFFFAMILILMVPIFLLVSFYSVYMEKLTGSIIPGAILNTLLLSFTILSLTPLISILDFLFIFIGLA